ASSRDNKAAGTASNKKLIDNLLVLPKSLLPVGSGKKWEGKGIGNEDDYKADVGLERGKEEDEGEQAHEEVEEPVGGVELTANNAGRGFAVRINAVVWSESGAESKEEAAVGEVYSGGDDIAAEEVEEATEEEKKTSAVEVSAAKVTN